MFKGQMLSVLLLSCLCQLSVAKTWVIESQHEVENVFKNVQDFDSITVKQGHYLGPWHITQSIIINAEKSAVLDGQGLGHALQISANNVEVNGLSIINWGDDIGELHSGVFVNKAAEVAIVDMTGNRLQALRALVQNIVTSGGGGNGGQLP